MSGVASSTPGQSENEIPRLVLSVAEDPLQMLLQRASLALLRHPLAAQELFSALIAEGRRFGTTEEGRAWRDALSRSDLVRRGRAFWEGSLLNMLEDSADTVLPSAILDAMVQTIARSDMIELLQSILSPGAVDEQPAD